MAAIMHASHIDTLYRQHHPELLGFLTHRTGCRDQAADLCHEVYLRLFKTDVGALPENPRAYLFRVARNLLIDQHRRAMPERIALESVEPALACPRACPETALCDKQCLRQLGQTLSRLPERQRQALIWHRLEGLTQREIGERLGVSERMAGRYIAQAVTRCQAELETLAPN
ncbi:RNA polymerase sigma factor [Salinicola avicenniae]|uniref:RNA polymerase sigma factor n=1 Tax=Salinicola avicenniae TaxID=2916836 RepID=UPI0020745C97|nr:MULTISPECIES: RNA polymerase sigma factor [unclassified Salinicola]